jgi:hypothetical protein
VICLLAISTFRQETTELCRFSAIQARFAFGNNFYRAKCDERGGYAVG